MGRHYTKTLSPLILQEIDFFYKEKIKIILSKHHGIVVASKDSLCPSFIFTINYFLEQGKHKKVYYQ